MLKLIDSSIKMAITSDFIFHCHSNGTNQAIILFSSGNQNKILKSC